MKQTIKKTPGKKVYLQKAKLKGFRTIHETEIDFDPGLNILIGKNGVGKSNFLKLLHASIIFSMDTLPQPYAFLVFSQNGKVTHAIEISKNIETIEENGITTVKTNPVTFEISRGEDFRYRTNRAEEVYDFLDQNEFSFSSVLISHGLPPDYDLVERPLSFKIDRKGFIDNYPEIISNARHSYFLKGVIHFIFLSSIVLFLKNKSPSLKHIKTILSKTFELFEFIKLALEKFANIEGLRINKNYNLVFDRDRKEFSVSNLFLEFKVERQWLPFSHLSDGTRRLFYIISEIAFPGLFQYQKTRLALSPEETNKIILIEEPELGLHPHQLYSLMHFLREAAENHQIIVTTHAPQVLDILEKEELNKIIIARLSKKGTTLRHLTEKEQEKAGLYIEEEAYLSDYWRYSDLES